MAKKFQQPNLSFEPDYILYTDGGCAINPGGPGGYGSILIDNHTGEFQEFSAGYFASTNNRMEIMAVIAGMEHIENGARVHLYADSQYVLRTINGEYQKKKNLDLWKRLDDAMKGKEIEIVWVKGHNGNQYNERCDELATLAMSQPTLIDDLYNTSSESVAKKEENKRKDVEIPQNLLYYNGEQKEINRRCGEQISTLNAKAQTSFKDYVGLKTGGMDEWSRTKDMDKIVDQEILKILEQYFTSRYHIDSCLRWYCRGLRLDYAIRKVKTDLEVAENAMKYK